MPRYHERLSILHLYFTTAYLVLSSKGFSLTFLKWMRKPNVKLGFLQKNCKNCDFILDIIQRIVREKNAESAKESCGAWRCGMRGSNIPKSSEVKCTRKTTPEENHATKKENIIG